MLASPSTCNVPKASSSSTSSTFEVDAPPNSIASLLENVPDYYRYDASTNNASLLEINMLATGSNSEHAFSFSL